jgi:hypothetical protein
MTVNLSYHQFMKREKLVTVVGFMVLCLALVPSAFAQINGVPSSVTSIGFGGHPGPHGVPPSVTSIGPKGLVPNNKFQTAVPSNNGDHHHHHDRNNDRNYGGYGYYAVPYAAPYYAEDPNGEDSSDDQYNGGPTVFDRRGPGQPAPYQVSQYTAPAVSSQPAQASSDEPAAPQPQTILVFKDGHQLEVSNYAIVGSTLYDLTPGHARRVPLADLNLTATAQRNDSLGVDFQLPGSSGTN